MDKIVGKIATLISMLFCAHLGYAQVTLRALDINGIPLKDAMVGSPFMLEVAVTGYGGFINPTIAGVNPQEIIGRSFSNQIANGATTAKHFSVIKLDKPGVHTLGPAEVVLDGKKEYSNSVVVTVNAANEGMPSQKEGSTKSAEPILFARLESDKARAVIGEKIKCTLQIYSNEREVDLPSIRKSEFSPKGFTVQSETLPSTVSVKNINGVDYKCLKVEWELYPVQAGELTIPAVQIYFNALTDASNDGFFGYSPIKFYTPKRAFSNPLTITAVPLPPYNGTVHGVGSFDQFTATMKPTTVCEGDGMVLTLELQGSGDLQRIETLPLVGLPPALKWYDSKNYYEQAQTHNNQAPKKCFEYIVQGLQPGEWEIPSQPFVFFDSAKGVYKKLETQPIVVTIRERAPQKAATVVKPEDQPTPSENPELPDDIGDLERTGKYVEHDDLLMPWWLFNSLIIVPLLITIIWLCVRRVKRQNGSYNRIINHKRAFIRARKALDQAHHEKDYNKIYSIFIELIALRTGINQQELSEDRIVQMLQKLGCENAQIKKWQVFFEHSAALVFAQKPEYSSDGTFFKQAYAWLDFLETKI